MNIREIKNEMIRLHDYGEDQEYDHKDADKLLVDLIEILKRALVALGHRNEVENIDNIIHHYNELAKWYA